MNQIITYSKDDLIGMTAMSAEEMEAKRTRDLKGAAQANPCRLTEHYRREIAGRNLIALHRKRRNLQILLDVLKLVAIIAMIVAANTILKP